MVNSNGAKTQRDSWSYGSSAESVSNVAQRSIDFYNDTLKNIQSGKIKEPDFNTNKISWTRAVLNDLAHKKYYNVNHVEIRNAIYRPFFKQNLLWYAPLVEMRYRISNLFPNRDSENVVICVCGVGVTKDFSCTITNILPDLELIGKSQCFPLYYYEELDSSDMFASKEKYVRKDAVSDYILKQARTQYNEPKIKKEDIFYYVYGFLHSEEYRTEFSADLKKMLPRIPLVDSADDFWAFSNAGRKLAEIHLNYETAEPYKVFIVSSKSNEADLPMFSMAAESRAFFSAEAPETLYKVRQMRFAKKQVKAGNGKMKTEDDKTRIVYNDKITVANIPLEAYEYVVNGKSAIEWIMERYAVTTDKASGITNDPNDWALEHNDPKYIFNLLLRIITVSLETMKIVNGLPKLKF